MAKVITEQDIKKLHRAGQLDKKTLRKPEPKKPELPLKPLPEIEAMNKALNQLVEIFRTSKDISDRNDKVAEFLSKRVDALESKGPDVRPMITGLTVTKRDNKDFIKDVEFVYKSSARAV